MRLCVKCKKFGVFGTDTITGLGYCKSHQYLRTDRDTRTPLQKALDRDKLEGQKEVKQLRFQPPKKIHKGTFDESVLNSNIEFITPTPESYDGKITDVGSMDEMPMWEDKGVDESIANLTNDLDQVLSLVVRYKYARPDGMVKCFCCPKVIPIKEAHNSHYVKRGNRATRFLEANCRASCPECNNDHNYDETPYTNALESEQPGLASELKELGKITYKATRSELKEQLIELRSRLEILKLKIKP